MPIDLTDFTQIPNAFYHPTPKQIFPTMNPQVKGNAMKPTDPSLISLEMQEALDKEAKRPTSMKKHFWSINDFEDVPYNEADAARIRKERGIPEPEELVK